MQPNIININIQIAGGQPGQTQDIPVEVDHVEAQNTAMITRTGNVAEQALAQLHRTHFIAVVKATKISHKILKKILLEAIPNASIRIINLGLKLLVLVGV